MIETLITAPVTSSRRIYGNYAPYPGNADLVYDAICKVLSERQELVNWEQFGVDEWRLLAQMAEAEGVGPLLHWKARPSAPAPGLRNIGGDSPVALKGGRMKDALPPAVQQQLRASYYQTAAQNAVLFNELERILAAFDEAGIPVIVLKGAALAQTLYPDPGLRPMGDVDLLIHENDIKRASKLLLDASYAPEMPELWPGLTKLYAYEVNFDRLVGDVPIHIELHWNLIGGEMSSFRPEVNWFWQESERQGTVSENSSFEQLKPEAHWLYLAAHLFIKHIDNPSRLIWLYDMALSAQKHKLDWQFIEQQSKAFKWQFTVNAAQKSLYKHFSDDFLVDVPQSSNEKNNDPLAAYMQNAPQSIWGRQMATLRALNWKARLLLTLSLAIPSPAYMQWRYQMRNKWMWPFFLLRRWWEIGQFFVRI